MEDSQPPPENQKKKNSTKTCSLDYFIRRAIGAKIACHSVKEYAYGVVVSGGFQRLATRLLNPGKVLCLTISIALSSVSVYAEETGELLFPQISYTHKLMTEQRGEAQTDMTVYRYLQPSEKSDEPVVPETESYCNLKTDYDTGPIEELLSRISRISDTYTDDLPDLFKRGTIRILTTYSPANFFVSSGRIDGFEYSLLKEYERYLNQGKNRKDLKIVLEYIPVPEQLLIPCLKKGIGDVVAAGSVITTENTENFEFTDPYLTGIREVLVSRNDAKPIRSLYDLAGRQIFVRPVKSYYDSLTRLNQQLSDMGLDSVTIIQADESLTNEDIFEMINSGSIELSMVESHLADLWSSRLPRLRVHDKLPLGEEAGLSWMVRRNNPLLKLSLNKFIRGHKKGTRLGNIYFNRYFKDTKWINSPLDPNDREKSFRYAPLFKKYGAQYNIDWKLLSAIAYQESMLNNRRKSPKGAIGIMQILPSTALDPRINISNYQLLENNIHAGAKYLALLRDTYFNDSEMEPMVRLRYALAAYNAGPTSIREARTLAAKMGYDPNRWFRHGEIGALKLIGQEPVRYVSNINKYYLAYSLADALECLKQSKSERVNLTQTNSEIPPQDEQYPKSLRAKLDLVSLENRSANDKIDNLSVKQLPYIPQDWFSTRR